MAEQIPFSGEVAVELAYAKCGASLTGKVKTVRGDTYLEVDPCETCVDRAEEKGYYRGLEVVDGRADA